MKSDVSAYTRHIELEADEVAKAYAVADASTQYSVRKLLDVDMENKNTRLVSFGSDERQRSIGSDNGAIDFNKICKDYGIRVSSYKNLREKNAGWPRGHEDIDSILRSGGGISFTINGGHPVIVYDNDRSDSEIRYIVAHELGHILLGHLGLRHDFKNGMPDSAEAEANIFAAVLTANDVLCRYGREAAV